MKGTGGRPVKTMNKEQSRELIADKYNEELHAYWLKENTAVLDDDMGNAYELWLELASKEEMISIVEGELEEVEVDVKELKRIMKTSEKELYKELK